MVLVLKLIQWIVAILQSISPKWAAKFAIYMAAKPHKHPMKPREIEQLSMGKKIMYTGAQGTDNCAWVWGEGPVVLVCHGWESRAGQMATLATAIAKAGFTAVAMDFTAHGLSGGSRLSFKDMSQDLVNVSQKFGKIYAMVGHSAGGVMSMGARQLGFSADVYAVMGSPVAPYPALNAIRKYMKASDATLKVCQDRYAANVDLTWADMESGIAFTPEDKPLLAIFDDDDKEAEPSQGDLIASLWPNSILIKTQGLGHRKLMWAPEVIEYVVGFLKEHAPHS